MTPRIKLFFAFLAVATVLSLISLFGTFPSVQFNSSFPGMNQAAVLPATEADTDKDGLTDALESYWNTDFQDPDTDKDGFKDGEEVLSSHDPTIAGPDDKIISDNSPQNITQKIGGLVLSGLYVGDLRQDSPNFDKSVDAVVDDVIYQYALNAGSLEPSQLLAVDDTRDNTQSYANTMRVFIQSNGENILRSMNRFLDAANTVTVDDASLYEKFFQEESERLTGYVTALEQIAVPRQWLPVHQEVLLVLKQIRRNYALIWESESKIDPIQGGLAASTLSDLIYMRLLQVLGKYQPLFTTP